MEYKIVLSDHLLKEYYRFKHAQNYNPKIIEALFHYYKAPFMTNIAQLKRINIEDQALFTKLLRANLTTQSLHELCSKSKFKVILDDQHASYPYVNILDDALENNYSATFYKRESRQKAQAHLKALLKEAKNLFIYDRYFENNWAVTQRFFRELLPQKPLTIFYKERHLDQRKSQIKRIYSKWTLKEDRLQQEHQYLHDRYLIIDNKIEIILTSGFDYLFDEGKDFSYIVREKS
jgi:hypothetical protein